MTHGRPINGQRVRMLLARHIGEQDVAHIEQAYDIIQSTDRFTLGRESADLLRMAALLLGHRERPSSLVAPCPARNDALSLGRANRSAL